MRTRRRIYANAAVATPKNTRTGHGKSRRVEDIEDEHVVQALWLFSLFAACLVAIAALQIAATCVSSSPPSVASTAGRGLVVLITLCLAYDNFVCGIGAKMFPTLTVAMLRGTPEESFCERAAAELESLRQMNEPRFLMHAVLTPLLGMRPLQLARRAGLDCFPPGEDASCLALFAAVAAVGLVHHLRSPRIQLQHPHPREPESSWMRGVLCCTRGDSSIGSLTIMIGPAIGVCLMTIVVGVCIADSARAAQLTARAGHVLWVTSAVEIVSNAGPPWISKITGAAGEVVLMAGFVAADLMLERRTGG